METIIRQADPTAKPKTLNLGLISRTVEIRKADLDEENRTVEIAFSSETPYERWFGIETLSHRAEHVDMSFIGSGNAPLLAGHNHDDQIGVIEKAWLQDGVGRAVVRFGKSNRAQEFFQDVQDGIRKNVSVGYFVMEMELKKAGTKNKPDEYLVTRWKPVEASIVSVPADESVGIREADETPETLIETKELKMEAEVKTIEVVKEVKPDMNAVRNAERVRQSELLALGKMAGMESEADAAIREGMEVNDFRAKAFDKMLEKQAKPAVVTLSENDKRDLQRYSLVKAIRESGEKKLTGIENEMAQEAEKQFKAAGIVPSGQLSVPYHVLAQRDLTVGPDSAGGYTVATNLLASSFIDLLNNRTMVRTMGARVLDNLVGDIKIPSMASGATGTWEGENDANAESSPTFGQVELAPNRVGTYVEISKKLLVQSSLAIEQLVQSDIAGAIARAIDVAALHGTGTGDQPTGIAATSGIGSVVGGTNGAAPTWANIIGLETEVAQDNADIGSLGYLTNAKVRGKLKQTFTNATYGEIPLWTGGGGADGMGMLNGYRAGVSNQVSSTLTKGSASGVCSAIFFGNWADLILAYWGGLDIVVDPYSLATTNLTRVTVNTYADVAVRHAQSFAAMLDALTA